MRFAPAFVLILLALSATTAPGQVTPLLDLKVFNGTNQIRVNEPVSFARSTVSENQFERNLHDAGISSGGNLPGAALPDGCVQGR